MIGIIQMDDIMFKVNMTIMGIFYTVEIIDMWERTKWCKLSYSILFILILILGFVFLIHSDIPWRLY